VLSSIDADTALTVVEGKGGATAIEEDGGRVPPLCSLSQNIPNPFNLETTIEFRLPEASVVDVSVYNLQGQRIQRLLSGVQRGGHHRVIWDGKDEADREVASGIYLYRLTAGSLTKTRKALLLK
jgi:hypothetical protein